LPDRPFHRGIDRVHLRGRDFFRNPESRSKRFVYFRRPKKLKSHFFATGAINTKERCASKLRVVFKQAQRLSVFAKGGPKSRGLLPCKLNYPQFCYHDRPAKNGDD